MTTTITVAAPDLFRAGDILYSAFRADHGATASHRRMGLPVTCWPVLGGVELGASLAGGVLSIVVPATVEGDLFDEFTFALAAIRDQKKALGKGSVALVLDGDRFRAEAAGATVESATSQGIARKPGALRHDNPSREVALSFDLAALPYVAAAALDDDTRPALTMVHCEAAAPGSSAVNLIAADGFRLHEAAALATVDRWDGWDTKAPHDLYVSLPAWLVAALGKLGAESVAVQGAWWDSGPWEGAPAQDGSEFLAGATRQGMRLAASWQPIGAVPDFRKITTSVADDATFCQGKMAELAGALAALAPVAKYSANIFRVTPEPGALELESKAAEVGAARRRVAVSGQGLAFAACVRYWQDALGKPKNGATFAIAFDERMVRADRGFSSPIRLSTEQPFGDASAIIMPMHIAR